MTELQAPQPDPEPDDARLLAESLHLLADLAEGIER